MALFVLIQGLALAGGSGACLLAARRVPPSGLGLMTGLCTAVLFSALYTLGHDVWSSALFSLAAGAGGVAAAVDARHHLLPDAGAGVIALAGLTSALVRGDPVPALLAGALSAGILAGAGWLTRRSGRGKTLGEGDVLLAGACGLWLAPALVPYGLLAAVFITAMSGLINGAWRRGGRAAFGPGLLAGFGAAASVLPLMAASSGGG